LRREGRSVSAEPVCSCALLPMRILARETAGAARTRSSLRPHSSEGAAKCKTSGDITPRDAELCSVVIVRESEGFAKVDRIDWE
jgi:hypothetical protein